jgi:hypothetical protein
MDCRRDYKASEVADAEKRIIVGNRVDIDLFATLNKGTNEAGNQDESDERKRDNSIEMGA